MTGALCCTSELAGEDAGEDVVGFALFPLQALIEQTNVSDAMITKTVRNFILLSAVIDQSTIPIRALIKRDRSGGKAKPEFKIDLYS